MSEYKVQKTYEEINARIRAGQAVVVTAEEMVGIVKKNGPVEAARKVDVVTTGTFSPMCSTRCPPMPAWPRWTSTSAPPSPPRKTP